MAIRINAQAAQWMLGRARARATWPEVAATLRPFGDDEAELQRLYQGAVASPDAVEAQLAAALAAQAAAAPGPVEAPPPPAATQPPSQAATASMGAVAQRFVPRAPLPPGRRFLLDHGPVEVAFRLQRPQVALLHGLLTDDECDALIAEARPRLERAEVVDPRRGGSTVMDVRTSELASLPRGCSPLVARIDARIAALTGLPLEQGEHLQVMHYGVGAEYQPHYDFFHVENPGEARLLDNGGQRVATLVTYLADVEAGGETVFPLCGLSVSPRKGSAVYFAYTDAAGLCDRMSYHVGVPVQAGEKWIVTRWFREGAFR